MEKIILVKPNLSYADEILKYKKEFLEDEPIYKWCSWIR